MVLKQKKKEYLKEFEAREDTLSDIREFVLRALGYTRFSQRELTAVLLVIEEACTNVIRHAYLYGPGYIKLRVVLERRKVTFDIIDTGRKFDFDTAGTPDLERYVQTSRKGGLGLYLIRKIMDNVEYYSSGGENCLHLEKTLPSKNRLIDFSWLSDISIRKKFAIWLTTILTVLVLIIYFYFDNRTTGTLNNNFMVKMKEVATTLASQARENIVNDVADAEFYLLARNFRREHTDVRYVIITGQSSTILANSEDITSVYKEYNLPSGVKENIFDRGQKYGRQDSELYHFIQPVFKQNPELGKVHIGFSSKNLQDEIWEARRGIFLITLASYAVGLLAVILLSNYFVKPIQKLTDGVKKIGSGNLDMKLPVEGADEFSEIALAFNEMTSKIKQAQKKFLEQETMQKELQVAQEIQHTLLPKHFPDIEGYDISTIYKAAKDVGGDYFDFFWVDEKTLGIAVADVSGKGVPGSLVMTMIRTAIRLESRGNRSAVDILTRVNHFVSDDVKKGMFVTIFLVVLDSVNRRISFASAGHNPMVLYRHEDDKTYFLNPRGIPLGISLPEDVDFATSLEAESIRLKKDDILIIYTDGITEAMDRRREQFGMERFLRFIKTYYFLTPEEFTDKLKEELLEFTHGAPQNDDITLVAIKEKVMADDYLLERRKKLLSLVADQGMTVKDACLEMKVSTSTYYKYKKRYEVYGEAGLKNKIPRSDDAPRQISYEERSTLLKIIRKYPEYGTKRLKDELESGDYGDINVDERMLYDELVRLRLNTRKQRLEYAARTGEGLSDEQKEILNKEAEKYQAKLEREKQEYIEKLAAEKEAAQANGAGKVEALFDSLAEAGLPEDEISDMMEMFSDLKDNVDQGVMMTLVEKMKKRVNQIELDLSDNRVLDQSRFKDQDLMGWKKVADEGIDLNLLDNDEETDSFSFDELSKKLEKDDDEKS